MARSTSLTVATSGWFQPKVCTEYTPVRSKRRFSVLLQSISSSCLALPLKIRPFQMFQSKIHIHLNNVSKVHFRRKQIKIFQDYSGNQVQPQNAGYIYNPHPAAGVIGMQRTKQVNLPSHKPKKEREQDECKTSLSYFLIRKYYCDPIAYLCT